MGISWNFVYTLPSTFSAFAATGISIDTRRNGNITFTMTMRAADGTADSTIDGSNIKPGSNNTWATNVLEPGSSYSAGDKIVIEIIPSGMSIDSTADFTGIQLNIA